MTYLKIRRWFNIFAALILAVILAILSGALTEWEGQRSEIEFPAEEFDHYVTYPDGFWLFGYGLFFAVTLVGASLLLFVRNAVITVDGYRNPRGSFHMQISGCVIAGLGMAFSALNPFLGPLVYIAGLACLVFSLQQKCPHHLDLLES